MKNNNKLTVEVDGVNYTLNVNDAIMNGSLTLEEKRYYPYTFYKYSGDFWILIKDSENRFNLVNLNSKSVYNVWYRSINSDYLTAGEWVAFVTPQRIDRMIPVEVRITEVLPK